jgi:ABC-2 type transport system ATP-binding protein
METRATPGDSGPHDRTVHADSADLAIEVRGLRKSYGSTQVLRGIDLDIEAGGLVALLGPNGAGKTTTVRILATLLRFEGGSARVFGHDVRREARAVRRRIGLTGQFASVDDDLTGLENLTMIARLQGYGWRGARERGAELLEAFDLSDAVHRQVKRYSGGMRRRLDIAASVVVAPELLFLDEPTTGLDPRSRRAIWQVVRSLRAAGSTVLLTTQYLEEADALADRIVILDHGSVIADDSPDRLKDSLGSGTLMLRLLRPEQRAQAEALLRDLGIEPQPGADPAEIAGRLTDPQLLPSAVAALDRADIGVSELSLGRPSLDDVFLTLTGEPPRSDRHDKELTAA